MQILEKIENTKAKGKKQYAVLIDPDKVEKEAINSILKEAEKAKVDYLFVGGSLLTKDCFEETIQQLKSATNIPVVIFPGDSFQISKNADALLFLSLISGRNPELLIGKHVSAAPFIKKSGIEAIPTGYMLIDTGKTTTAFYMSQTFPIPSEKSDIAACTAMAGEMLGLRALYLDAGSGAKKPIPAEMIKRVKEAVNIPIIIGGGIRSAEEAIVACNAGADIVVTGNIIEQNPELMHSIADAVHKKNR